ncbi:DUF5615 family PIN-like protein [Rubidibacter lacunae]|uniref:DUF5615 family PIN-like protein n=1 Tax=Rubidibacter lacunae TaxID=582514 RepID=UPI00040EBC97|nr:DUF5615 family PIN-like protein [Rubidibacter lacunae]
MPEATGSLKLLLDENLSPNIAKTLCEEDLVDAVSIRNRGHCGRSDREVWALAYKEDRILVTANVKDFEAIARASEVHGGLILLLDADLRRSEQLESLRMVIPLVQRELAEGRGMINRALYFGWRSGEQYFWEIPREQAIDEFA